MRNKKNIILSFITALIIALVAGNIYLGVKVSNYREDSAYVVKQNLGTFATRCENKNIDSIVYAGLLANIECAQDAYFLLSERQGIHSDEYDRDLGGLLIQLSLIMNNDKEKFEEVFSKDGMSRLMFNISDNFEDRDSIKKVYDEVKIQISKL